MLSKLLLLLQYVKWQTITGFVGVTKLKLPLLPFFLSFIK